MRALTRLFGSTFTDVAYISSFKNYRKIIFHLRVQLLVSFIYLMQQNSKSYCGRFMNCQSCYFFIRKHNWSQFEIPVTFEQKVRRLG